jgi:hypothetical protein
MGTRSTISIEKENGTLETIYCHWNGYPSYNGEILLNHYTTPEKVQGLVDLGDISLLGELSDCPEGHSYYSPSKNRTVAYGRDRGEEGTGKTIHQRDAFPSMGQKYSYIFRNDGKWEYSSYGSDFEILTPRICKED